MGWSISGMGNQGGRTVRDPLNRGGSRHQEDMCGKGYDTEGPLLSESLKT